MSLCDKFITHLLKTLAKNFQNPAETFARTLNQTFAKTFAEPLHKPFSEPLPENQSINTFILTLKC